jgi:hypothetical protein
MDLTEIELADVESIGPAQDRDQWKGVVNTVINIRVP